VTGIAAFVYSDEYLKYSFGSSHPFQPIREKKTFDLLRKMEIFNGKAKHYEPRIASEDDLLLAHTREYVAFVKKMSEAGSGYLDFGDTPATKGLYEGGLAVVGGSLTCADLIMKKVVSHAFNPGGGLHHAKSDRASGFCVFNDIAITVRYLQKRYGMKRIAIIDIDGHHGDGTQELLNAERILVIDFHRAGFGFFPGTGFIDEVGVGEGQGYTINVPLPAGTGDETYMSAFKELVPPLIRSYKPDIILNQFGVDGHYGDPLVGLSLTTDTYKQIASTLHVLSHEVCSGRYLVLGGGGYNLDNVPRCWATMFLTISEVDSNRLNSVSDSIHIKEADSTSVTVKRTLTDIKRQLQYYHGLRE
jgi:acetoin utilization protein AcuC